MSLSREFAGFVAGLQYEDLPPEVVDRAVGVTLQALSSALVAHDMPGSRQALALMREEEAGGGGAAAGLCAKAAPCATRYSPLHWPSTARRAARRYWKARPASTTPMPATTAANCATALPARTAPISPGSPKGSAATGFFWRRSTAFTRRPATTSPMST